MRLSSMAGTRQAHNLQTLTMCKICPAESGRIGSDGELITLQPIRIRGENMLVCAKCAAWTREMQKVQEAN